jgi:hypothetical protein
MPNTAKKYPKTTAINYREMALLKCNMTDILPVLLFIASDWNLKLSNHKDHAIAKKILINSVHNN